MEMYIENYTFSLARGRENGIKKNLLVRRKVLTKLQHQVIGVPWETNY